MSCDPHTIRAKVKAFAQDMKRFALTDDEIKSVLDWTLQVMEHEEKTARLQGIDVGR